MSIERGLLELTPVSASRGANATLATGAHPPLAWHLVPRLARQIVTHGVSMPELCRGKSANRHGLKRVAADDGFQESV